MPNATFQDLDALMNASLDDIEDLPPIGVPPTGHYNLTISASRKAGQTGSEYIKLSYEVEAVNEVKLPEEESEAVIGMKFSQTFSPFKFGPGLLKEACAPFAAHFGTKSLGDTLANLDRVTVAASLVRRKDKKDPDRWNFSLKDVVVL